MMRERQDSRKAIIDEVARTSETLTGRGGLALVSRYLRGIELLPELERVFGSLRRSRKGQPIRTLFHQLICFFVDGTSRHLVRFDELREDAGYAGAIETAREQMVSSHSHRAWLGEVLAPFGGPVDTASPSWRSALAASSTLEP